MGRINNRNKSVWVIYPFTSTSIGAEDNYVIQSNSSNAFYVAMRRLQHSSSRNIKAIFLTTHKTAYEVDKQNITFRFLPLILNPGIGHSSFGRQWSWQLVRELIREKPGLVFLFIGGGWFAIFLALVCRLLSIPYCPIIAGWGVSVRKSQRWYYNNSLHVIVHTNAHKDLFQRSGIDTGRFLVMPMGVDTELFKDKFSSGDSSRVGNKNFLFVARIVPSKNISGALRVFAKITEHYDDASFNIVGPVTDEQYFWEIKQLIVDKGLENKVAFYGNVENNLLPAFYSDAVMMIFPTLSESFGFAIVESMASGTPVAALRGKGSPDEIIEDGIDGVLAEDEEELAERILELLANPDQLAKMGRAARNKVEQRYSVNRTYTQLMELIEEVGLLQK